MAIPTPREYSEQHKVAVTDVRYGRCYNDLCARFYTHCDFALNVLQVGAGSTTIAGAFGKVPTWLSVLSGAAVAVAGIVGMLWSPAAKAERHKAAADAFIDLHGRAWSISTAQLLRELATAQKGSPPGLRSLEMPAFNRNVRSIGAQSTESLGPLERLCDLIA